MREGYSKNSTPHFTAPLMQSTWMAHAAVELQFLWASLRYHKGLHIFAEEGCNLFEHDKEQKAALQTLQTILDKKRGFSEKAAEMAVDNDPPAVNIFQAPLIAYLACMLLAPSGGYTPIDRVTRLLSKVQFCMHLQGLHHLMDSYESLRSTTNNAYFREVEAVCSRNHREDYNP